MSKLVKFLPFVIFSIISIFTLNSCQHEGNTNREYDVERKEININTNDLWNFSERDYMQGVSGGFSGFLGGTVLMGGGCNFPDMPVAEGGKKRFYSSVFSINKDSDHPFLNQEPLYTQLAYGASALKGDTLLFIGGTNHNSPSNNIMGYRQVDSNKYQFSVLKVKLPFPWYEGAAVVCGDDVYLIGGWKNNIALEEVIKISLATGSVQSIISLPDGARIQPVAFISGGCLYLYGGFNPGNINDKRTEPHIHKKAWKLNLDQKKPSWKSVEPLFICNRQYSFVGTAVCKDIATKNVYAVGGVNIDLFEKAIKRGYDLKLAQDKGDFSKVTELNEEQVKYLSQDVSYYQFEPYLLSFDPSSEKWVVVDSSKIYSRAGAFLASENNQLFFGGGEIKPGIRIFDAWELKICDKTTK